MLRRAATVEIQRVTSTLYRSQAQTLEALRILKTRLAAIDQEHDAELAVKALAE
jgi:hypothetical protein